MNRIGQHVPQLLFLFLRKYLSADDGILLITLVLQERFRAEWIVLGVVSLEAVENPAQTFDLAVVSIDSQGTIFQ